MACRTAIFFFSLRGYGRAHKTKVLALFALPFEFSTGAVVGRAKNFLWGPWPLLPLPGPPGKGKRGPPVP